MRTSKAWTVREKAMSDFLLFCLAVSIIVAMIVAYMWNNAPRD